MPGDYRRGHPLPNPAPRPIKGEGEKRGNIDGRRLLNHNDHNDHIDWNTMITETNAVAFRQNLGEMLSQVQYRHDSVVINKDGKPVAALVDARLFERIRRMQGRFDALCQRLEAGFANVPEEQGLAEIDAAVAAERAQARAAAKRKSPAKKR
jgi:prevent-host-death family protein